MYNYLSALGGELRHDWYNSAGLLDQWEVSFHPFQVFFSYIYSRVLVVELT